MSQQMTPSLDPEQRLELHTQGMDGGDREQFDWHISFTRLAKNG